MALVNYSDSESETERVSDYDSDSQERRPVKKQRRDGTGSEGDRTSTSTAPTLTPPTTTPLPPLPDRFLDLYAVGTRLSTHDDPSLHGGRKRTIPHITGNWPTHVYLEWHPTTTERAVMEGIIGRFSRPRRGRRAGEEEEDAHCVRSLLVNDLETRLPLHVSLSRAVMLTTSNKQAFAELFDQAVGESGVRPFCVSLEGLSWESNLDQSRWFLVLRLSRPVHDELNRLLSLSNRLLARFNQPPLYENPTRQVRGGPANNDDDDTTKSKTGDYSQCFHISIAWKLGYPSAKEREEAASVYLGAACPSSVRFGNVKLKIGNVITSVPFREHAVVHEKGFVGL